MADSLEQIGRDYAIDFGRAAPPSALDRALDQWDERQRQGPVSVEEACWWLRLCVCATTARKD